MITVYMIIDGEGNWQLAGEKGAGPEIVDNWNLEVDGLSQAVRIELPIDPESLKHQVMPTVRVRGEVELSRVWHEQYVVPTENK